MNGKSRGAPRRNGERAGGPAERSMAAFTQGCGDRRDWRVYFDKRGAEQSRTTDADFRGYRMFWSSVCYPSRRAAQVVQQHPFTSSYIVLAVLSIAGFAVK